MQIDKQWLIREFQTLVSMDSPSFGERQMGDYLKKQLTGLGFAVEEDDAGLPHKGNCGNLHGFLEGNPDLAPILFCTHMDTVEPSRGKRAVLGEDGVIRSRGDTVLGADDCAGTAAVLEALRVIREEKLEHRPIEVLFTVAEELYCKGIKGLDFSRLRAGEAYILDLSAPPGSAAYQAPTILSLEIKIKGRSSHAGFAPEKGVHAIKAAAEAIAKLPMGRIDEDTTFNIGVIEGGKATNIIPDLCVLSGEIRSYSHEKALVTAEKVRAQLESAAKSLGAEAEFDLQVGCRAYTTPLEHPVVRRFELACETRGLPFSPVKTFGGSDNNVLAEHGITGLVLASAMYRCHSVWEYTTAAELIEVAGLALALMTESRI